METERRWISSKVLFGAIYEQLAENRQAVFTVTGMSMWPFLCHGRDQVIVEKVNSHKIKKGDIVLFQVTQEQYFLHRITKCHAETFESAGDGNFFKDGEFSFSCVIARVKKVIRPEKTIDCNSLKWRCTVQIWMWLFPFRKKIVTIWIRYRKKLQFIKKIIF